MGEAKVFFRVCLECSRAYARLERCHCGRLTEKREPSFFINQEFGTGFRVRGVLGAGGMGVVFQAAQASPRRQVALKVPIDKTADLPASQGVLEGEVASLAALEHPNIVRLYAVGSGWGLNYFVMEYLRGVDLERHLARNGPLEPRVANAVLGRAAEGLTYAHGEGYIHCDLKPANVFITTYGSAKVDIKLLDFGLAQAQRKATAADGAAPPAKGPAGTMEYMAPEQFLGSEVGRSTDQYALALIAAEMLTGSRVRHGIGRDFGKMKKAALAGPVELEVEGNLTDACVRAIGRATAVDPARRFSSVREFVAALRLDSSDKAWEDLSPRLPTIAFDSKPTPDEKAAALAEVPTPTAPDTHLPAIAAPDQTVPKEPPAAENASPAAPAGLQLESHPIGELAAPPPVAPPASSPVPEGLGDAGLGRVVLPVGERGEDAAEAGSVQTKARHDSTDAGQPAAVHGVAPPIEGQMAPAGGEPEGEAGDGQRPLLHAGSLVVAAGQIPDGDVPRRGSRTRAAGPGHAADADPMLGAEAPQQAVEASAELTEVESPADAPGQIAVPVPESLAPSSTGRLWTIGVAGLVLAAVVTWRLVSTGGGLPVTVSPAPQPISQPVTRIEGSIVTPLGQPLAGAAVAVRDEHHTVAHTRADSTGRWMVSALPPGKYSVIASAPGYRPVERDGIAVGAAAPAQAELSLLPEGTERPLLPLRNQTGWSLHAGVRIDSVKLGRHDEWLAASAGVVRLWSLSGNPVTKVLGDSRYRVTAFEWTSDGGSILAACSDGVWRAWDVRSGMEWARVAAHVGSATALALEVGGSLLATGGDDGIVRLWEVKTARLLRELRGHRGGIGAVTFQPGSRQLASAGKDGTVRVWDADSGAENGRIDVMNGAQERVQATCLDYAPDGRRLALGGFMPEMLLLDSRTLTSDWTRGDRDLWLNALAFAPDGLSLATGGQSGRVSVFDTRSGKRRRSIEASGGREVTGLAFFSDGRRITIATEDGVITSATLD